MSETTFACPHCKQSLEASDDLLGQTVQCPSCKQNFTVPKASASLQMLPTAPTPRTKACPFCGEDILTEARKCKHCGETVDVALRVAEESKKAHANQPMVFMNAGGGGGAAATAAPSHVIGGQKSQGVAIACWCLCLIGICGAHRFYLGDASGGLLYLCTFGLCGIGQVIDLLGLSTKVDMYNAARR